MRAYFEVDGQNIVVAALHYLATDNAITNEVVQAAIDKFSIDMDMDMDMDPPRLYVA